MSADENVDYSKDYAPQQELPPDLKVIRVHHRQPSRIWHFLKRRVRVYADFPDYYKSWYRPALAAARKTLRECKVDLIYSASPTFTTALVAMQLKKESNIPWVADFLDGWAVNDFTKMEWKETLRQPLRWFHSRRVEKGERKILQIADKTVVISWHVKQRLCELHRTKEDRIVVIPDGFDESVFGNLSSLDLYGTRLTITFLGNYYRYFSDPIKTFLTVVSDLEPDAEIVVIGRAANSVHEMYGDNTTCILNMPRSRALSFGLGSDFLLVVMPSFAKWIPSKIYDYLRLGKPILGLVPNDGDAANLIRNGKAGYILSYEPTKMMQELKIIFEDWKRGTLRSFSPDIEYVKQFQREKLTQDIAKVFDQTIS